ncbi:copper homeostasis protein CutC [Luteimonas aquatica]|uniref:copper homeostasis protein CutC n=1 Tax=Luteimonas aquatica TaxID=450364 RepID=UPI001F585A64|nr:copper homeostasis protein CutC [Luteimonas aquatica]
MSAPSPRLEIAANSLGSALAAQAGGADRIELCENLAEGGCTPSYGMLAVVRERLRIPVYVLIRPRGGDFLYDQGEREVMLRDIEACVRLGCDGVVLGALDADGAVDTALCRTLIDAARPLDVTFHRAFDAARDRARALEDIVALGCGRILTSGGAADALQGADAIAASRRQAQGRLSLMAGAGVTAASLPELLRTTGVHEVHASARVPRTSAMRYRNDALPGLSPDWMQTEADSVRHLAAALRAA